MSEKVVLTVEQAIILENEVDFEESIRVRDAFMKEHVRKMDKGGWLEPIFKPLNQLSIADLARALYVGYEIEKPKFQAGDKIIHCNEIFTLEEKHSLMDSKVYWSFKEAAGTIDESYLTKAKPEEIYWLHELGRDSVGEFREGDVIITQEVSYRYSVDGEVDTIGPGTTKLWMDQGIIKGIYPVESFKPMKEDN